MVLGWMLLRSTRQCRRFSRGPVSRSWFSQLTFERLEDRTLFAFDLTISTAATVGVSHVAGSGVFTASNAGANINVSDVLTDLRRRRAGHCAGRRVT